MRANGMPGFPDPVRQADGRITFPVPEGSGKLPSNKVTVRLADKRDRRLAGLCARHVGVVFKRFFLL